jgi:hypothetical protein
MKQFTFDLNTIFTRRIVLLGIGIGALLLASCASSSGGSARGHELRIRYAEVVDVERVKMPSAAPAGAVVGGFTGLILSRNKSARSQVASGVGGAALGALATRALEGERLGYSYQLRFADSSISQFITEKGYLQRGDCVSVERGEYANIRRVAKTLCESGPSTKITQSHIRDAQQCHAAKDQLLAASTDEEILAASRKVRIICQ